MAATYKFMPDAGGAYPTVTITFPDPASANTGWTIPASPTPNTTISATFTGIPGFSVEAVWVAQDIVSSTGTTIDSGQVIFVAPRRRDGLPEGVPAVETSFGTSSPMGGNTGEIDVAHYVHYETAAGGNSPPDYYTAGGIPGRWVLVS